ncbi:hypothetical protein J6O48_12435 [bacterium]|nr:hypothetical protein [bacterium]
MKRFLLGILITITFVVPAFSQDDEEILPLTNQFEEINLETNQSAKKYNLERKTFSNQELKYDKSSNEQIPQDFSNTNPNNKRTVNIDKKKKIKDFSVGTKNTGTFTSDTYSSKGTVYTEYEKNKFKINSSYSRNNTPCQNNQDKGSVSVTPEYKINKHVSVQNVLSNDMNTNSKKSEVKVNVKPFKDDRMDMGVGVGQKFSGNSAPSSSQVNFSTNIRF